MAAKRSYSKKKSMVGDVAAEIYANLNKVITDLTTSERWPQLLKAMAQKNGTEIGRYSFGNMLLIWAQMPEASAVCSYKAWRERGRQVLKDSTSIRINAPMQVKSKDADGKIIKDKDGKEKTHTIFKLIPVFDISQTEPVWQDPHGMQITPSLGAVKIAKKLQGDAPATMIEVVTEQINALGYTVQFANLNGPNGAAVPSHKRVMIQMGMADAQTAKTLAHELGHLLFDHVGDLAEYSKHQGKAETEAESFAYMVCAYYGLDSATYSAPYISTWAGSDAKQVEKTVQATGDAVLKTFRAFLATVEAPEQETAPEEPVGAEPRVQAAMF
jgi:hypothetical protein